MKIIDASYEIKTKLKPKRVKEMLQDIEETARTCYQSEDRITKDGESAKTMIHSLIKRGHEAMLEHASIRIRFICDRGVSHEIVRHRLAAMAQESTRYCDYTKDKFKKQLTVIRPSFFRDKPELMAAWEVQCLSAEESYFRLRELGAKPEEARSVLPHSVKTTVTFTMNLRELRHFLRLRTQKDVHPQMLELTRPLLAELQSKIPVIFDDITYEI